MRWLIPPTCEMDATMVNRNSLLVATLAILSTATQVRASEGWYPTFEDAQAESERSGRPLLIHFHATFCGPCRQMAQQVFSQPDVQRQLRDGIVAVEVDVSERRDLAGQFGVATVPRDVVVMPGQAPKTLAKGFQSKAAYLRLLASISPDEVRFAATDKSAPNQQLAVQEKIIGLDGFCPVRLMRDREWISGREDLAETHRGITYYFSSSAERQEFRRTPEEFTPENLGCDPVVLYSNLRAVTGKIKYGAFFDSQLYLFETVENRETFKENPLKFTRIRHAVKVDDLKGQRFN
ncbi:Thioredoxin-like protein [Fuerstiella marisgermanici]|uniref:Thioredoxin-like protein n=2 Tax=Fuerstiella marisgermanici TaxID=1891926 RepID=A0A1P8WNM8_9PLAN|nr:Thioredoxin-like protein [Fuerstiella marisgermanici]